MLATVLLFGFLAVAAYTDVRWGRIYNTTVYTGILVALGLNAVFTAVQALGMIENSVAKTGIPLDGDFGLVGLGDCLTGFLVCGLAMLTCYVFFAGGVGGGDVKLIAMMGAFFGLYHGLEAMLWTFVLAACSALVIVVWQVGAVKLLKSAVVYLMMALRWGAPPQLTEEERRPLRRPLYLSPSAAAAALLVRFRWFDFV